MARGMGGYTVEGSYISMSGGSSAGGFSSCRMEAVSSRACLALGILCSLKGRGQVNHVGLGQVGDAGKFGSLPCCGAQYIFK